MDSSKFDIDKAIKLINNIMSNEKRPIYKVYEDILKKNNLKIPKDLSYNLPLDKSIIDEETRSYLKGIFEILRERTLLSRSIKLNSQINEQKYRKSSNLSFKKKDSKLISKNISSISDLKDDKEKSDLMSGVIRILQDTSKFKSKQTQENDEILEDKSNLHFSEIEVEHLIIEDKEQFEKIVFKDDSQIKIPKSKRD